VYSCAFTVCPPPWFYENRGLGKADNLRFPFHFTRSIAQTR
jgi:hypothetical protein